MTDNHAVVVELMERLAPSRDDVGDERTWCFSQRMEAVYQQQMGRFDENASASEWRRRYSAENMPPPDDTRDCAEVAAQVAFYFPTHFFKFQKAALQQLLQCHVEQTPLNPYPFGAQRITLIDVGAGVGTACLSILDLLATWMDVLADHGYRQLGVSVKVVSVDPDRNKETPRRDMLAALSSLLDTHSLVIESPTDVVSLYPEPECIDEIVNSQLGGTLGICCISNFLSSRRFLGGAQDGSEQSDCVSDAPAMSQSKSDGQQVETSAFLARAARYAEASRSLLANLSCRRKLLLASDVDEQGRVLRAFARSLGPSLDQLVRRNRVRFISPEGCYWALRDNNVQSADLSCAVNFWSLAHWTAGADMPV